MTILERQVLALGPDERAHLVRVLLDSLEPPGYATDAEEHAEIERRARRVQEAGAGGASWAEVRAEIEREIAR